MINRLVLDPRSMMAILRCIVSSATVAARFGQVRVVAPDAEQSRLQFCGRKHYWFLAKPLTDPAEDTDRWAIEHNLVSLTPLRPDLTDETWLTHEAINVLPNL
jgi:broad specificity polyphosphatase/5'/3'-nucleotidase SurE